MLFPQYNFFVNWIVNLQNLNQSDLDLAKLKFADLPVWSKKLNFIIKNTLYFIFILKYKFDKVVECIFSDVCSISNGIQNI